jgi:hypothetical protein
MIYIFVDVGPFFVASHLSGHVLSVGSLIAKFTWRERGFPEIDERPVLMRLSGSRFPGTQLYPSTALRDGLRFCQIISESAASFG